MAQELNRILLVEDEPDIQEVTKTALELVGGFQVDIACNGNEGIQKAQSFLPDLILLDMMMPGKNGIDTLDELKRINSVSNIPVIFMTAKVQPNEIAMYKDLGAIDVISKPFDPMQLSIQIREIWEKHYGR